MTDFKKKTSVLDSDWLWGTAYRPIAHGCRPADQLVLAAVAVCLAFIHTIQFPPKTNNKQTRTNNDQTNHQTNKARQDKTKGKCR